MSRLRCLAAAGLVLLSSAALTTATATAATATAGPLETGVSRTPEASSLKPVPPRVQRTRQRNAAPPRRRRPWKTVRIEPAAPGATDQRPSATDQRPPASRQRPPATDHRPTATDQRPPATGQRPPAAPVAQQRPAAAPQSMADPRRPAPLLSPENMRVLVLTATPGEQFSAAASRSALLVCDPPRGSHPQGAQACGQLSVVNGEFTALRPLPGVACTMQYDPVTVTASGIWDGRTVRYQHTFGNSCVMRSTTGSVFAF
ncbi:SSI family serine proteinase inhibitor [Streptosporangium sandarakinum]|uniref:SSI family serine proteinase inhibitor n=1 Tax=Streptosporangium sandarakinum TaxID=1260955 RepID=UPI003435ADA7